MHGIRTQTHHYFVSAGQAPYPLNYIPAANRMFWWDSFYSVTALYVQVYTSVYTHTCVGGMGGGGGANTPRERMQGSGPGILRQAFSISSSCVLRKYKLKTWRRVLKEGI